MGLSRESEVPDGLFEALWCPFCGCEDWVEKFPNGVLCERCHIEVVAIHEERNRYQGFLRAESREWFDADNRDELYEEYPVKPFSLREHVEFRIGKTGEGIERSVGFVFHEDWIPKRGDNHDERVRAWDNRRRREEEKDEVRQEERSRARALAECGDEDDEFVQAVTSDE